MKNSIPLGYLASTLFLLPLSFLAATSDANSVAGGSESPKTHTLFMGTDFSVEIGSKLYRIADVNGANFVVSVDGQKTLVPMRGERHSIKVVPTLKLTSTSLSVTGFSCQRAYTPRNDPEMRRQVAANEASAAIGDSASLAEGQFTKTLNNGFVMELAPRMGPAPPTDADILKNNLAVQARDATASETARVAIDMATAQENSDVAGGGYGEIQAKEDLARQQYDAVEVNFSVSSEVPLEKPYLFLIVNYRENGSKLNSTRKLIYAKALDPIGIRPEKIHLMQGGLPLGYTLESYQLHLYDSGIEIASDVAPKRVSVTREDAFQYVKVDYLTKHKGATLPAAPALGKPDSKVAAALSYPQMTGVYYVRVSKDGLPLGAFTDQECTIPVEQGFETVVKSVRFYPALNNGVPVEGVARLVLTKLTI